MNKFRLWDNRLKELYKSDEITIQIKGQEILACHSSSLHQFIDYVLMQSTGLKDKNGVEIYEGDIVEFKYPYDKRIKSTGVIVRNDNEACFGISMKETTEQYELYRVTAENYLTVIGNVHQHPELLEDN